MHRKEANVAISYLSEHKDAEEVKKIIEEQGGKCLLLPGDIRKERFCGKIVKQYKMLCEIKREYVLSKQMLRSGTSIGANVREAHNAESKMDFIHKMGIAQKEASEVIYWIELLYETEYLTKEKYHSLANDATELIKIIRSIILSSKQNLNK